MKEKILETENGNVHYWINEPFQKERMTLFFLHGLTASHQLFKKQIPFFKEKYNLIVWDAPAHGSSRPYEGFTYEKSAEAARLILLENGFRKAVWIGQSMGGFIVQAVIRRFPHMVSAFISIDSTPFGRHYYSRSDRWWLRQVGWMSKLYPDKFIRTAIARQCTTTKDSYENMLMMLSEYSKDELCLLLGAVYKEFLNENSDLHITCPVLLIVGKKDITGKVRIYNQKWAEDLGVTLHRIEHAAHNSNDDQPEVVNQMMETFLERVQAEGLL